ncbi:phosphatidylglycerophosphatase B [Pirellulimonas nuda]|uniref:Phosphatidylglycerophosphatase B n=1 Tax=Pirellulimonas nuda TaxID=2528009 RepID=A0A518DDJ7_9BACT|nr:phosphatase PAP2 family protein [Pirellulimonas nuda]QDU89555.1 phosphatidylglycerophosphatase B [Pirellulimonas nuda]
MKPDARLWIATTAAAAAVGLLSAYLVLAGRVARGSFDTFDRGVLLALRNADDVSDPIGPRWVEEVMRDCTAMGGMTICVLLSASVVIMLLLSGRSALAGYVGVVIVSGVALCMFLKASYDRPRPQLAPHGSHVYTKSFPSGHTMTAATVYLTLGAMLARVQRGRYAKLFILAVAVGVTLLVGLSRVYLAVHWPTDVIAGWLLGAGWALLAWCAAALLTRRLEHSTSPQSRRLANQLSDSDR